MQKYYIIYQRRYDLNIIDDFCIYTDLDRVKQIVNKLNERSNNYSYRELYVDKNL